MISYNNQSKEEKISCGIIRVDFSEPVPHYHEDGVALFDSSFYRVDSAELPEIINAIRETLIKINYPYIRVYFSGCILENKKNISTKEDVINMYKTLC